MEIEPDNHLVIDIKPGGYRVRATGLNDHQSGVIHVQLQPASDVGNVGGTP